MLYAPHLLLRILHDWEAVLVGVYQYLSRNDCEHSPVACSLLALQPSASSLVAACLVFLLAQLRGVGAHGSCTQAEVQLSEAACI